MTCILYSPGCMYVINVDICLCLKYLWLVIFGGGCVVVWLYTFYWNICRSRLTGIHTGTLDQQRGGTSYIGGAGETVLEIRHRMLKVC